MRARYRDVDHLDDKVVTALSRPAQTYRECEHRPVTAATSGFPQRRSRTTLALLVAIAMLLLGGCVQLKSSMSISDDDRVSGQLLISTRPSERTPPPNLRPPPDLSDRVQITPYSNGGRAGSQLSFQDLSFDEVEHLGQALSPSGSRHQLHLTRSGSLVIFDASLDLTPLANTNSSFLIELSAPGEITTSNGQESAGLVSWSPEPGEVNHLSATYQFAGTSAGGWIGWAALLGLGVLAAVALSVVLARRAHQQAGHTSEGRTNESHHVVP